MISKCPNCGGELRYDIGDQLVVCDFCGKKFDPKDLLSRETDKRGARKASAKAKEVTAESPASEEGEQEKQVRKMKVKVFTCPNCGGDIISTDLDAVDYCSYCGSFVSLESHLTRMREPEFIIPFKVTGEECRSSYKRFARKRFYAPSQLKDDEYLERFRSIYIPYWMYDVGYGSGELEGRDDFRKGNYVYHKKFAVELDMDATVKNIPYDASSTFDDSISDAILPFDPDEMEPFNTAALLGHFADTADVPPRTYEPEARATADQGVWDILQKVPIVDEAKPDRPSYTEFSKGFNREVKDTRLAMLPVWFLTWRRKDRIAYSVVNGSTGEISAEMPVSIGRFLLGTLLCAVPLFIIFNLLFMITATKMMLISSLLTLLGVILSSLELKQIAGRETHVYDKGYLTKHPEEKKRSKAIKTPKKPGAPSAAESFKKFVKNMGPFGIIVMMWLLTVLIYTVFIAVSSGIRMFFSGGPSGTYLFVLLVCDVVMFFAIKRARKIAEVISYEKVLKDVMGSIIAIAIAHIVVILHPAEDLFYYITAVLCLLGVVMTMIGIIRRYNAVVTRPLPHFFDRTSNEGEKVRSNGKSKAKETMAVILMAAVITGTSAMFPVTADALDITYHNEASGFDAVIMDEADLLTDEDEQELLEIMKPNTEFGHAVLLTSDEYVESTYYLAGSTYTEMYGSESGSIFVIDMYNRYLYIYSDGLVYKFITKSYANTITDNVYRYATKGLYRACAEEVFTQELKVLKGIRIAQPMKYVDNLLLALIGSLFINYMILRAQSRRDKATQKVMMESSKPYLALMGAKYTVRSLTKTYSPPSSSSGGGGGGGGGGFSGGGGGHGF